MSADVSARPTWSPPPAVLKINRNERRMESLLCTFGLGENAKMDTQDEGMFSPDDARNTVIS